MRLLDPASPPWPNRVLSVMRIVAALLIIEHGTQKWFGFPAPVPPMQLPPFGLQECLDCDVVRDVVRSGRPHECVDQEQRQAQLSEGFQHVRYIITYINSLWYHPPSIFA